MPRRRGCSAFVWMALCAGPVACGGGAHEPATAERASSEGAAEPGAPSGPGIRSRLQGTWEIAQYAADPPVPEEASPLMANLFGSLRLRFEGGTVTVSTGKGSPDSTSFDVVDEQGDAFTLRTNGGMFDGARCKMQGDDAWEATVTSGAWPGTTTLRRAKSP